MTKKKRYSPFEPNKRKAQPAPTNDAPVERPNLATINTEAAFGKAGFRPGDVVRIQGTGTYSGEEATIEKLTTGVIPSAIVRTANGNTRHVRTIDLVAVPKTPAS
jgi:hypothetical protein